MILNDVIPVARELEAILAPACQEIQVAGSVRRGKPEVHDLEFVLLPVYDTDMFGDPVETYAGLDMSISSAIRLGKLKFDTQVKRDGPKLKRLIHPPSGLIVEIYIADERNFGNLLTIRTGCSDFSRRMVTSRVHGGMMPTGMRQIDGYLHRNGQVVPCRTEEDFFREIGVQWIAPELRTSDARLAVVKPGMEVAS